MNKTAIKNFSIWARSKLIADIQYRAGLIGITSDGIANPLPQSTDDTEFYDIGTAEPYSIHGQAVKQRKRLVELLNKKAEESDYAGNHERGRDGKQGKVHRFFSSGEQYSRAASD